MKLLKNTIVFSLLFFFSLTLHAQFVNIPDTNFRTWLNSNGYASCMNGNSMDTTCPAVVNAMSVDCWGYNISDLNGIQYFDNLQTLQSSFNNLNTLPILPPGLEYFVCEGCNLVSIPPMPSLLYLNVRMNQLTSLPPLPSTLQGMEINDNAITNLPVLPQGLYSLTCDMNDISFLPTLPSTLQFLSCRDNLLTSLPVLPAGLRDLVVPYNNLNSLPILPNGLENLNIGYTTMTSLPTLPDSLENLICDGNYLQSLPALPSKLRHLNCNYNELTMLPTLPDSLGTLYCGDNLLTNLPTLPNSLGWLDCGSNPIDSLPQLPSNLNWLYCDLTQISWLPALPVTLRTLNCTGNAITSLPELPDTLDYLKINYCPINCLPEIKWIEDFYWLNTDITCLPNQVNIITANPSVAGLGLCQPSGNCPTFWNISGNVFKDVNSNCINDGEDNLRYIPLNLDSAGITIQQFLTAGNGNFSFRAGYGTYEVKVDTTGIPFNVTCPATLVHTSVLSAINTHDSLVDFALQCKPGFDLIAAGILPEAVFRPAALRRIHVDAGDNALQYSSNCATGISGTVQVILDGPVSYSSSPAGSLTPTIINGDTLSWNVADFSLIDPDNDFDFISVVDTFATINDTICLDLFITPVSGDYNQANNTYSSCFNVVNSFDPNAKLMQPSGAVDTSQQWFTFTIFFQNTGNAPAEDIYLLDTLMNTLDANSFTFLSSSHDVITQMLPGNVLRFNFPDINLIDSTTNEPESHGVLIFKIKRNALLPAGTVISNKAYIYFDYNAPVITNTVSATLTITTGWKDPVVSEYKIIPNPTTGHTTIYSAGKEFKKIEIFDVMGKLVFQKMSGDRSDRLLIDLKSLQQGIYFIKLDEMTIKEKIMKVGN